MMVEWLFLAVPWGCLRFVIVVSPDHSHLLFLNLNNDVNFYQTLRTPRIEKRKTQGRPLL